MGIYAGLTANSPTGKQTPPFIITLDIQFIQYIVREIWQLFLSHPGNCRLRPIKLKLFEVGIYGCASFKLKRAANVIGCPDAGKRRV